MPSTAAVAALNTFNPLCTLNLCLQYVVGSIHKDAAKQSSLCEKRFGTVVVETLGPYTTSSTSATTLTDTVYTTIITSTTLEQISTSVTTVPVTVTTFTTTDQETITTTEDAQVTVTYKKRSQPGCKPRAPRKDFCADLDQYSSACACILAASTTTTTATPSTVAGVTATETALTTSATTTTASTTTTTVELATTSSTTTLSTNTLTTTTVTTTVAPPVQTRIVRIRAVDAIGGGYFLFAPYEGEAQDGWLYRIDLFPGPESDLDPIAGTFSLDLGSGILRYLPMPGTQVAMQPPSSNLVYDYPLIRLDSVVADDPSTSFRCTVGAGDALTCQTSSGWTELWNCYFTMVIAPTGSTPPSYCSKITLSLVTV